MKIVIPVAKANDKILYNGYKEPAAEVQQCDWLNVARNLLEIEDREVEDLKVNRKTHYQGNGEIKGA